LTSQTVAARLEKWEKDAAGTPSLVFPHIEKWERRIMGGSASCGWPGATTPLGPAGGGGTAIIEESHLKRVI
jgi:hypothetical protein